MAEELEDIYEKLKNLITEEEFKARVEEKITLMSGLCDLKTAAMLVMHELGVSDIVKIRDIAPGNLSFLGKVMDAGEVREFHRNDGSLGRVANLTLGDETGSIRVALWDEAADLVKIGDIKTGQSLSIRGYAKEGPSGLEVNVGRGGSIEHLEREIAVKIAAQKITEIRKGMEGINVVGKVISVSGIRTFHRRDGSIGKIGSVVIGDETGKIRVILWDGKADFDFRVGDTIEILNAYARENLYGLVEIQIGSRGVIRKTELEVKYSEKITPIADIGINEAYTVVGYVSGLEEAREFERNDGTKSKVASIYLSDNTGRIRVALWGDHADLIKDIDIGTKLQILDCYAKPGRNEEVELSVGARSTVQILHD